MSKKFTDISPLNPEGVRTYDLAGRQSKVNVETFKKPFAPGSSFASFLDTMPAFLQAEDLKSLASAIAKAHKNDKVVALAMGAHNIKVGLQPLYADLMERGIISSIALNGAAIVHDFELAFAGMSSEDVGEQLGGGQFGMARQTGQWLNRVILEGHQRGMGIGEAVGKAIWEEELPHRDKSLLAAAYRTSTVATVHVALGTDIIHMHPSADGEAIGGATMTDFKKLCSVVKELEDGVYINIGSAVILPEVFLKALTLVRNLGAEVSRFTAADMDFIRHYRPGVNVVSRPTAAGGAGYRLTGPHEILVPLLFGAVLEQLN